MSNNSRLTGRKDANWNEEESSCRLKSRQEWECGKALDAGLEVFCFVLFLNYASNTEYFLAVQDSSNTHDVNKALSTLSKSPLQRKHCYWIGRYPSVRLETSCINVSGHGGALELSEPCTVSTSGTVSRGEQMSPEEWNNARHEVEEGDWGGRKRE